MFFGKEPRAGAKRIKDLEQAAHAKISQAAIEEIPAFTAIHKRVHSIMQIHSAYLEHGPDSRVFKECWRSMETWCSLEPKSAFKHPSWMQSVVHRKDIAAITDSKAWMQAIGLDRLRATGSPSVQADQASLIAEKAVLLLKNATKDAMVSAMKEVFNLDMPFDTFLSESAAE